jgi:hypothetical protein
MKVIASKTYESYIHLTFLMFFVIVTFGLIGMEYYAGNFNDSNSAG